MTKLINKICLRHDIAEILIMLALNTNQSLDSKYDVVPKTGLLIASFLFVFFYCLFVVCFWKRGGGDKYYYGCLIKQLGISKNSGNSTFKNSRFDKEEILANHTSFMCSMNISINREDDDLHVPTLY